MHVQAAHASRLLTHSRPTCVLLTHSSLVCVCVDRKHPGTHRLRLHDRLVVPAVAAPVLPAGLVRALPERRHEPLHANGRCRLQGSGLEREDPELDRAGLADPGSVFWLQVVGVAFFTLASILYTPPPDSPHNSYESTESRPPDPSKLPVKDPPEGGAIANQQAR